MDFKKTVRLFINCSFMFLYCSISFTQSINTNEYRAIQWAIKDGLSNPDISTIVKDVNGFLWIGTSYGLNRLDGNTFKYYFSNDNGDNGLNGDGILGIKEDSLHNIWIGTGEGLNRYDIKADTFTNFSSSGGPRFDHLMIPFWCTRDEVFCMDYNQYAIVAYNIRTFTNRKVVILSEADSLGLRSMKFQYSILDEQTNSIWMLPEKSRGALLQISLADGKRIYYPWPVNIKNRKIFQYTVAEAMKLDPKRNCIWINSPQGLMQFSLADKQYHSIDALKPYLELKDYDRLVGIDIDSEDRIWFATQPKGILIYNPADKSIEIPFPHDSAAQVNTGMANACLYCDRDGTVWTGSWFKTGVFQLAPFSQSFIHYVSDPAANSLSDNTVIRFARGNNENVWIRTGNALNIFDSRLGKFSVLKRKDVSGIIEKEGELEPISVDTVSKTAFIQCGNLYKMDLLTKKCLPVIFKDPAGRTINPAEYKGLFSQQFKEGCMATLFYANRECIYIIDKDSMVARELLSFPEGKMEIHTQVADGRMVFIPLISSKPYFLTYTYTGNKLIRTPNVLDSVECTEIMCNEADRSYWVAAKRQLLHYNKDFHLLQRYTAKDGLPEIEISSLTIDDNGNLWFHTDRSVVQLNTETRQFSTLSAKDGFEKIDFLNYAGGFKSNSGDIYFPTGYLGQGFVRVRPDKFISPPSAVYIENIEVNQKPLSLSTRANSLGELSLPYFQNKLNISTGILDFYSKGASRLRYKLEGQDTNWQYSSYYSTIRYEGLPTGKKFTLLMQASNASNEFNGPVRSLLLFISPAFWETWWFRIAALLFLALLFYGFIRWRLQQKFRFQLERSEREVQIAEIKQKSSELEMQALRAQMNPHFIFNSLNSINRFILQNNRVQASEYLTKFSKLVRMILQNSQSSLITLENELESLGLYLEMEALRFNYHFTYHVSVPKDLDIEMLQVPPLILQPYVENAIWHGLMHKEEKGQLNIAVSQDDDHLFFKITDNGIGRKKASELASKSATKHKSMGLRITAQRIAMMQTVDGLKSPVQIHDLVSPDGDAAGTEVIIKMPVIEQTN